MDVSSQQKRLEALKSKPESAKSAWDEGVKRFLEFDLKMQKNPPKERELVPATPAWIGRRLGLARYKAGDLYALYQECKRSKNPGAKLNWFIRERIRR